MKTIKKEEVYLWEYENFIDVAERIPYFIKQVYEHVTSCQIIQEQIGSLVLLLVTTLAYSKDDETQLLFNIRNMLGDTIDIELKYVDSIPKSKNGKYRMIISKVKVEQQRSDTVQ